MGCQTPDIHGGFSNFIIYEMPCVGYENARQTGLAARPDSLGVSHFETVRSKKNLVVLNDPSKPKCKRWVTINNDFRLLTECVSLLTIARDSPQ